jgi:phage shock protein C
MTEPLRTKFYLDKQNKKWLGVCSGIADYTGIDATVVRIILVLLTVLGSGTAIIAYLITAWIAPVKPGGLYGENPEDKKFWQGVRASPSRSLRDVRSRFREIDRRLASIETYVTSPTGRLANEIEKLR